MVFDLDKLVIITKIPYLMCCGSGSAGNVCFLTSDPIVRGTDPNPDPSITKQK
jgi:hypothetical protein